MRHRSAKKKLNRTTAHRESMERNFVCSLLRHERVVTTLAKAKFMRPRVEKMITLGKKKDLIRFRRAIAYLRDEDVARKLFDEIGPRFAERPGGYTRIMRLSGQRLGDGTDQAILELVDNNVLEQQLAAAEADEE
jgi:large subunit ribosomal protein L17